MSRHDHMWTIVIQFKLQSYGNTGASISREHMFQVSTQLRFVSFPNLTFLQVKLTISVGLSQSALFKASTSTGSCLFVLSCTSILLCRGALTTGKGPCTYFIFYFFLARIHAAETWPSNVFSTSPCPALLSRELIGYFSRCNQSVPSLSQDVSRPRSSGADRPCDDSHARVQGKGQATSTQFSGALH
jgi:hypothetical protein